MLYILLFAVLTLAFCAFICLPSSFLSKHKEYINVIFVITICASYFYMVIYTYFDGGIHDWNFQNTLPVANVSPFMFACVPLSLILPKRIRKHFLMLISLLSVGMLLSGAFGCVYNVIRNYKFHIHFTFDYAAHLALSLYGIYLVKSGQVKLNVKGALISSSLIGGVAAIMTALNVIFDTAFFGLSLNGKHNIYNVVITDNSYLSALIYFLGLGAVLALGYLYCSMFSRKKPI